MTPLATAHALERPIVDLPSRFMLDMDTYAKGGALGFDGVDFYVVGRGGALGEVDPDVVSAAFVFFSPAMVRAAWERATPVMGRVAAAEAYAEVGWAWAEAHVGPEVDDDLPRAAELLARVVGHASPAGAPLFAAWRALPVPPPERPRAQVLHLLNVLRELRGGLHGGAVLAAGVDPHQAVSDRSPVMLGIFGWDGAHPDAGQIDDETWAEIGAATDRAMASAFTCLGDDEADELVEVLGRVRAAVS